MGLFAVVEVKCPGCGNVVEFQSKAAAGTRDEVGHFDLETAPVSILLDLNGESKTCSVCKCDPTIVVDVVSRVAVH